MEADENKTAQEDEIAALVSIYGEDVQQLASDDYEIRIHPALPFESSAFPPLSLRFKFRPEYPTHGFPSFWLSAPWLHEEESALREKLEAMYDEQRSEIIFMWIEWLRENTIQYIKADLTSFREVKPKKQETDKKELRASKEGSNEEPNKENQSTASAQRKQANENEQEELFQDEEADATYHCGITILHSGFVTDRKSRFQSHLARVHSKEEVKMVLAELLSNKKIAIATHNIYAFRIRRPDDTLHEERDDDGETGAADKLLFLLSRMQLENVLVVVSRWYGGIHLGADRFKHITNIAKDLIDSSGFKDAVDEGEKKRAGGERGQQGIKVQSAHEVYNRLKYDSEFDSTAYRIGFKDDSKAVKEVSFTEFEERGSDGKPPIHQIVYIKLDDRVVWDHMTPFSK